MASGSRKSLVSLAAQSVGYGLGIFGRQVVVYLTLPLFTNRMPQAEYGLVSFSVAVMAFVNTLSNAGLHGAIFRFYHDSDDAHARRQVLGSSLFMLALLAILPATGFVAFADVLARSFLASADYALVIRVTSALLVVDTLVNYGYILLRIQVRPVATSISNLWIVAAQMGIALVFVYVCDWGAIGYLVGLLLGEMTGLMLLVFLTRRLISIRVSRQTIGMLLRYGLPLLPASLSMWALHLADRILIGALVGLDQVAVYEVGYKMGGLVGLAVAPFGAAWPPFAFAAMRGPGAPRIYRDVLTSLFIVSVFIMLGLIAFQLEILRLLAPATYMPALSVVGWVALVQVFQASYLVLSIGPKISKRTSDLALVAVLAATIYLILNIVLIPRIGIQGAAIATLIGYGLLAFGSYFIGQRSYPFPLDWIRLIKLAFAAVGAYGLIAAVSRLGFSGWGYYLGKLGAWFSFPLICLLIGVVTISQLRGLWQSAFHMVQARALQMKERGRPGSVPHPWQAD